MFVALLLSIVLVTVFGDEKLNLRCMSGSEYGEIMTWHEYKAKSRNSSTHLRQPRQVTIPQIPESARPIASESHYQIPIYPLPKVFFHNHRGEGEGHAGVKISVTESVKIEGSASGELPALHFPATDAAPFTRTWDRSISSSSMRRFCDAVTQAHLIHRRTNDASSLSGDSVSLSVEVINFIVDNSELVRQLNPLDHARGSDAVVYDEYIVKIYKEENAVNISLIADGLGGLLAAFSTTAQLVRAGALRGLPLPLYVHDWADSLHRGL